MRHGRSKFWNHIWSFSHCQRQNLVCYKIDNLLNAHQQSRPWSIFIHFTQAIIKSLLDYVKQVLCKGGEDAEGHVEVHPNSAKEGKGSGRLKTNIIWTFKLKIITFKLDMFPAKVDKPCVKLGGKKTGTSINKFNLCVLVKTTCGRAKT